ncbi:hypothetical protein [Pseudomonas kitaguniensis]|uniref:hypothetical protein n=1 Tax=Pseudomonas kitaguniensis TaxID=2607908 RepID=UPI003D00983A
MAPVDKNTLRRSYPATVDAKTADIRSQKILAQRLKTGEANKKDIPKKAPITPTLDPHSKSLNF